MLTIINKMIYNYGNYELILTKYEDNINLRVFDKEFIKMYEKNFNKLSIISGNYGMNSISNFYTICNLFFNHIQDNEKYKQHIKIIDNIIEINVDYHLINIDLHYEFVLTLSLIDNLSMDIILFNNQKEEIEKLKHTIIQQQKVITEHEKIIKSLCDITKINIYGDKCLPLICPIIEMKRHTKEINNIHIIKTSENIHTIFISIKMEQLLNSFRNIITDTIIIKQGTTFNESINLINFPISTKKLIIEQNSLTEITNIDHMIELHTIEIINCPYLKYIFNSIKNMKHLKTIKVINCPKLSNIKELKLLNIKCIID